MGRPKQTTPAVFRNIALPEPLANKLDLHLFSEVEGRVPHGAYKVFFSDLLEQFFEQHRNPCKLCNGSGCAGVKGQVILPKAAA